MPHTHWDREWYEPFQAFRMRLIETIDRVLDELDSHPDFAFTLDGQLATIYDYLEIRPAEEERVRRLIGEGRLAAGPWLILMDEFLSGGETMVRNLRLGWRGAEAFGRPMPVGYLPDMFGHVAQMPQILRRAGIDRAVVWRGVPSEIDRHRFRWLAPDGSEVIAEYLPEGYGNAAFLLDVAEPARVAERIDALDSVMRPYFGADTLLGMHGTDHTAPLAGLSERVRAVNENGGGWRIRIVTLPEYMTANAPEPVVESWQGELRSSARANQLMGVVSARIDLKRAMARAERRLARYAEPFAALWGGVREPDRLLDLAWRKVVECSAHDSICGCSVDPVVDQVMVRLGEADQIAGELAERAALAAGARLEPGDFAVLNPSPVERTDVVEIRAPVPEDWESVAVELPDGSRSVAQVVAHEPTLLLDRTMPGQLVKEFSQGIHTAELFGRFVRRWRIDEAGGDAGGPRLVLNVELDERLVPGRFELAELQAALADAFARIPADAPWQVRVQAEPVRRIAAPVRAPALGSTGVCVVEGTAADAGATAAGSTAAAGLTGDRGAQDVRATDRSLANGHLSLEVAADGTFSLETRAGGTRLAGLGRLVDEGDYGDTYNWAPPANDSPVDRAEAVRVEVREAGPVRGVLAVERRYRWPVAVRPDGSGRARETREVAVTTFLELRTGEPFVRIRIEFDNTCRDHRLRFVAPLGERAERSHAEGQFAVVERGLEPESGHGELALPTFPAASFVDAAGLAVLLEHVTEYELVDGGGALAITVLRATGYLSRDANPYRRDPAGPQIPIPGAQCLGPWHISFALYPHDGAWHEAGVVEAAERFGQPFLVAPGGSPLPYGPLLMTRGERPPGDARRPLPAPVEGLAVEGEGVTMVACRRDEGRDERRDERRGGRRGERSLELRVVCEAPVARPVTIRGPFHAAREIDLLGRPGGSIGVDGGTISLELGAWEIRTLQLDLDDSVGGAGSADRG